MKILLLAGLLLLTACAARAPLPETTPALSRPLPLYLQVSASDGQDALLVIQDEGQALRLSLFDPLGVPQARQSLQAGRWHNDGLLPPNPQARELFAALLFAFTADAQLASSYAKQDWSREPQGRRLGAWQIRYGAQQVIELDNGTLHYRVSPVEMQP